MTYLNQKYIYNSKKLLVFAKIPGFFFQPSVGEMGIFSVPARDQASRASTQTGRTGNSLIPGIAEKWEFPDAGKYPCHKRS